MAHELHRGCCQLGSLCLGITTRERRGGSTSGWREKLAWRSHKKTSANPAGSSELRWAVSVGTRGNSLCVSTLDTQWIWVTLRQAGPIGQGCQAAALPTAGSVSPSVLKGNLGYKTQHPQKEASHSEPFRSW